uniref:Putative ixodes 10 kDa peptide protein n=1 Tax=Ixodes ricinus TaxID=34613 RepID=A0A0K8RBY0_IXORI
MMLALFAVVLGLPASQGVEVLSPDEPDFSCWHRIDPAGLILCQLHGSKDIYNYRPQRCEVTCGDPDQPLKLDQSICPSVGEPCSESIREGLSKWKEDMIKTKERLMEAWCRCPQGN